MHCSKWYNQHITSSQWEWRGKFAYPGNQYWIHPNQWITAQMRGCNHYNNSGEFGSIYITSEPCDKSEKTCAASYCVILFWFCFSSFFSPMIWIWNDLILHTTVWLFPTLVAWIRANRTSNRTAGIKRSIAQVNETLHYKVSNIHLCDPSDLLHFLSV